MSGLLLHFTHDVTGCTVVFDAQGRAAYAWLLDPEGDIVGDVWLYNHGPAPAEVDFSRTELAPFPNPAALATPLDDAPANDEADVRVDWAFDGASLFADVVLRGRVLARLCPGSRPGWAALARAPGPLALPLDGAPCPGRLR